MQITNWVLPGFVVYILLFTSAVIGLAFLKIKRRKDRTPVEFKLLRGPGETLRKRLQGNDETFAACAVGAAMLPLVLGYFTLKLLIWIPVMVGTAVALPVLGLVIVVGMLVSGRWLMSGLMRYRSDALGYRGERYVAEQLEPLVASGYRVFHDVPAEGSRKKFNLDHVAVGPSGVSVIETKTYRKGRARKGFKDHEVTHDGRKLIWPWGESAEDLAQARNEAEWLASWIGQRLNIRTKVKAILALPGWWVNSSTCEPVNVVNAKSVVPAVERRDGPGLSTEQVDLIARQLETICRDVTD